MKRRDFLGYLLASASGLPSLGYSQTNQQPLKLGIFPRRGIKRSYKLFNPMANYLSEQLGRTVVFETAKSFESFWQQIKQRRYDIVHFNQYHYIVSHNHHGYDVFATNKELGVNSISGSIIVRKDSGINTIEDLKGKTILFGGGKRAMQSYISATWLLRQAGLQAWDYTEKFALNPPNTIISTYFKRSDASGSGDSVMKLDNVRERIDISQLKFLAKTAPMAHLPWAIKSSLATDTKQAIQSILVNLHRTEAGREILKIANLDALLPATDSDFNAHRKIITDIYGKDYGINILN